MVDSFCFSGFKGAVYFPVYAYNAYQTFEFFDPEVVIRDLGYAKKAGLAALRVFLSFEQFEKDRDSFWEKIDFIFSAACKHGLRIMPVLFENCGRDFSYENAMDRNPCTAVCVKSPSVSVVSDENQWAACFRFVDDFMTCFADDERLLAIEIMNEPHVESGDLDFAKAMVDRALMKKGTIPLTVGCISLQDALFFEDKLDILQFHDNFPSEIGNFAKKIDYALSLQRIIGKPVWLSEWQRLRKSGPEWDVKNIPDDEKSPCLSSLAPIVYGKGIGSFFWSLMIKPAYLDSQRLNGTFNGLFHEDGSVFSLEDYEAISGKRDDVNEKKEGPSWFIEEKKEVKA